MEAADRPEIFDEQIDQIKDAVRSKKLHKVEGLPREAFIEAAVDSIVVVGLDERYGAEKDKLIESQRHMQDCLDTLDEQERKQAINQANVWLSKNLQ